LTGDGFQVELPTVQDAVNCAINMQGGLVPGPRWRTCCGSGPAIQCKRQKLLRAPSA